MAPRRIIMFNWMTADGYFSGPDGNLDWVVPDGEQVKAAVDGIQRRDTVLFGRRTYERFERFWRNYDLSAAPDPHHPGRRSPEHRAIAMWLNETAKVVFSRTLADATWRNSRLVRELDPREIEAMKGQPGKDMIVFGSGSIVSQLTLHGLIDEYQLVVCPVFLGAGQPLLSGVSGKFALELVEARPYPSGDVMLRYAREVDGAADGPPSRSMAPSSGPLERPGPSVFRRLTRRPVALVAAGVVLAFVVIALGASHLAPFDPIATNFLAVRKPPSHVYRLGTDEVGRDVLSRLIWGARASLLAGLVPVTIAVTVSIPVGLLSGYAGGWLDGVIMRITDAMLAIPFLIVAIALAAFLGPSLTNAMIAIGIATLPTFVRLARGTALSIKTEDFVEAARALGGSSARIAVQHVLPNMLPPLVIQSSITVAAAIIAEASLSFLGLGQQPPAPSWGSMLNAAQRYLVQAPWMALYPGLMIFAIVMALNVLGDSLRDALDPRETG